MLITKQIFIFILTLFNFAYEKDSITDVEGYIKFNKYTIAFIFTYIIYKIWSYLQ